MEGGGLAIPVVFAPSFEHKANVSGAINPCFKLPAATFDPVVHAEGIALPFTTYLRRVFRRGGFSGCRVGQAGRGPLREVEPGIFLPDHPSSPPSPPISNPSEPSPVRRSGAATSHRLVGEAARPALRRPVKKRAPGCRQTSRSARHSQIGMKWASSAP